MTSTDLAGANHKKTAIWNRGLTVRLLRQYRSLSRTQLAEMTGLRGSTLTYIVRDLLENKVVRVTGKKESKSVGKKQALLELNPDFGWVAGFSIRPGRADVTLLDTAGQCLGCCVFEISDDLNRIPTELKEMLNQWVESEVKPKGKLLAVGAGIPGVVDPDHGIVLRSSPFDASDVPLQIFLADEFGVHTVIDHNATFGASAEATRGGACGYNHFLYLLVNHSNVGHKVRVNAYGSALYLNREIYRGAYYGAGELTAQLRPEGVEVTEEEFATLSETNAELAPALLPLAEQIGTMLGSLVNFIDVPLVLIAGTANITNTAFFKEVRRVTDDLLVPLMGRKLEVYPPMITGDAPSLGAAIAASDTALVNRQLF